VKFLANYFFTRRVSPGSDATDPAHDASLLTRAPRGLAKIQFHDIQGGLRNCSRRRTWRSSGSRLPLSRDPRQGHALPGPIQGHRLQLAVGELFALVVYGQLILEMAKMQEEGADSWTRSSTFMGRFSKFASQLIQGQLHQAQMESALR